MKRHLQFRVSDTMKIYSDYVSKLFSKKKNFKTSLLWINLIIALLHFPKHDLSFKWYSRWFCGRNCWLLRMKNKHLFSMGDCSDVFINAIYTILTKLDVIIIWIVILPMKCRCVLKKRWSNSVDLYGSYEYFYYF